MAGASTAASMFDSVVSLKVITFIRLCEFHLLTEHSCKHLVHGVGRCRQTHIRWLAITITSTKRDIENTLIFFNAWHHLLMFIKSNNFGYWHLNGLKHVYFIHSTVSAVLYPVYIQVHVCIWSQFNTDIYI